MTTTLGTFPTTRHTIRHLPAHLRTTRPFVDGRLSEPFQLRIGQVIAVHVLDGDEEVYRQLYRVAGVPYRSKMYDGIWLVNAYEGPYSEAILNAMRGTDEFATKAEAITLFELGMRRQTYQGVKVWHNRYTTVHTSPIR